MTDESATGGGSRRVVVSASFRIEGTRIRLKRVKFIEQEVTEDAFKDAADLAGEKGYLNGAWSIAVLGFTDPEDSAQEPPRRWYVV